MRQRLPTIVMLAILALLTVGCASSWLARAEQTEMSAFLTLDRFVALEHANSVSLEVIAPGSHALAERIRREAPDYLRTYDRALAAYRGSPGEATRAEVERIMAAVAELAASAQAILAQYAAGGGA